MKNTTRLLIPVLGVAMLTGCGWVKSKPNEAYKLTGEARPLEVPPDLDRPAADAAMNVPSGGASVSASQLAPATAAPLANASAFVVPGTRDVVYPKVAAAVAAIPGVSIRTQSDMLGVLDVSADGNTFLVRTGAVNGGVQVAAVNARGEIDSSAAAQRVIAAIKAALNP